MNILNSTDPIEISHELRIQHEKLDNDQSKIPSIGTMKVIAETALRFFEISNDNLKNPDQKKHLEFLIGKLKRARIELEQPEMSESAIGDIWFTIHRNTGGMKTFEEINKYLKY